MSQADPYQLLLAELQRAQQPVAPMFTPEQARARIAQNNAQMNLGIIGQMAGDDRVQSLGNRVFQQALGARQERVSTRGVMDPLTGQEAVSPEFEQTQQETRRGKLLQLALADQQKRQAAIDRAERDTAAQQHREDMVRLAAGLSAGVRARGRAVDTEMDDLKKQLMQTKIDAARAKIDDADAKSAANVASSRSKLQTIQPLIDEAINATGYMTAGLLGKAISRVPGTPAYDQAKLIDTIKARLGFDELAAMRASSPTGGALGNVSNREIEFLQAAVQNLEPGQSPEVLRQRLNAIKTHYQNWLTTMEQAHAERASRGEVPSSPATPVAGAPSGALPGTAPPARTPSAGAAGTPPAAGGRRLRYDPATGQLIPVTQ